MLTSNGKFAGYGESFAVVAKELTGDFTFTATVASISVPFTVDSSDAYRLGVMLCDCSNGSTSTAPIIVVSGLSPTGAGTDYQPFYAARTTALVSGVGGASLNQDFTGVAVSIGSTAASVPLTKLRIVRSGNTVTAYVSRDGGTSWTTSGSAIGTLSGLPAKVHAGVFAANNVATRTVFTNITITQP
ncbi:hypothetical protein GCM10025770_07760 [Viridibacterium curvum]|uniref:Uncharacterized protein n=1 Tax=Viridibacterium curvum TaxID=1101404 RepID=A0ABP9QDU9_9RHOO